MNGLTCSTVCVIIQLTHTIVDGITESCFAERRAFRWPSALEQGMGDHRGGWVVNLPQNGALSV